ncbi:MAG: Lar family restriction alleviation protein [Clostridia bacterium]|nr:Lar family restriction alleviation protein [Clostridia bacterium]
MDKELERGFAEHHQKKYGLLPCPFCGGLAYLEKSHRAFIGGKTCLVTFVRCVECNARSGREKISDYGKTSRSMEASNKVIEKWNRRNEYENQT